METQENQPKKNEEVKQEDQKIPDDSKEVKTKSFSEFLRELPYTNDRVGQVFIDNRFPNISVNTLTSPQKSG